MVLLLPAFSAASAARRDALRQWLAGFDVDWVLDMDSRGRVGTRIREWAQALGTMECVFRHGHRSPVNDATAAALAQLAAESAGAMLRLADDVIALGSSPSKLLAALDVHAPVSETYPGLARMFSWPASHPVSAASDAALAGLLDASRRCLRDLRALISAPQYPWRMPQGGEVHPCVGFWMGYFRCMLRNRVSLYFVLAGGRDGDEEPTTPLAPDEGGLVMDLIACLEAVLEEKSGTLAFPGLRQIFMLNNVSSLVRRAVRSDLSIFLPTGWVLAREERMDGYLKGYLETSWAPVVSRLDGKPGTLSVLRRRRDPLSSFYTALENVCSMQRGWKVPSPSLRAVLRRTVAENVVPAYRRYLDDHPEAEVPAHGAAQRSWSISCLSCSKDRRLKFALALLSISAILNLIPSKKKKSEPNTPWHLFICDRIQSFPCNIEVYIQFCSKDSGESVLLMDRLNTLKICLREDIGMWGGGTGCVMCQSRLREARGHLFLSVCSAARCWRHVNLQWEFEDALLDSCNRTKEGYPGPCSADGVVYVW